jgi:hypothetical protein
VRRRPGHRRAPARLALLQQVTTAWPHHALATGGTAWTAARQTLGTGTHPLGRLETKEPEIQAS